MSFESRPKAPKSKEAREKMVVRLIEDKDYIDDEIGRNLLNLIRKGLVYVYPNGTLEITEEGEKVVDAGEYSDL